MNKRALIISAIILIIATAFLVNINTSKKLENQEKIDAVKSSDKLFKIEYINYSFKEGNDPTSAAIYIDFDNKELHLITRKDNDVYHYKKQSISDEDMKVYKEVEEFYKEVINSGNMNESLSIGKVIVSNVARTNLCWEIGYKDKYQRVESIGSGMTDEISYIKRNSF